MPRKRPLAALKAHLSDIPANVSRLKYDPATGAFEAEFFPPAAPAPEAEDIVAALTADDPEKPQDFRFALERIEEANFPKGRPRGMPPIGKRSTDPNVPGDA